MSIDRTGSNSLTQNLQQQINAQSNNQANLAQNLNPNDRPSYPKAALIEQTLAKIKFNPQGLIPAIAQDAEDGTVLMMAWMNAESLALSIETGEVHYWSRSRQELWHKGATSGHIQRIKAMYYDCDADALLVKIEQIGDVACHTGARSCFFNQIL
ncbi:phosphoribosyl-AMP cyclohydrolase [Thalassoporum mexicanum PCC 7367]|nr:phosphoribosyl-AMP cyclohydrolase [Pseudanabaena sp. PCC 7367]AFY71318.1 phosphoribosyl-AMP cyclohydrolase [Pseudanabaena sp. PCC 7367]